MINTLLEILKPERAVDKEDESFRRGLDWLLQARPSDDDPINRSSPRVKEQAARRMGQATT